MWARQRVLRIRISEHKSSIRNRDERSPVARHFNSAGHGVCSLRFMGIEIVRPLLKGGDRQETSPERGILDTLLTLWKQWRNPE